MALDDVAYGPDGFPLCACGMQIRAASEDHPGLCAECIAKLPPPEQFEEDRPLDHAGADQPH